MTLIVGLTGGIGSGKSTLAKEFIKLGVKVVDADQVARQVVEPGEPALNDIVAHFGESILEHSGRLDRAKLRDIIFESELDKQWINQLLHPIIRDRMLQALTNEQCDYVILEAPLLFENDLSEYTQVNIVVDLPEELQLERAMRRDANSESQIRAIMKAQLGREERRQRANMLVDNSSNDLTQLTEQAKFLHQQLLSML